MPCFRHNPYAAVTEEGVWPVQALPPAEAAAGDSTAGTPPAQASHPPECAEMPCVRHDPYAAVTEEGVWPVQALPPAYKAAAGGCAAAADLCCPRVPLRYVYFRDVAGPPRRCAMDGLVRLFIGQLPLAVTGGQLQQLCDAMAPGTRLCTVQHIVDWRSGTFRGCVHAHCGATDAERIIAAMHERVLFERDGAWCARTAAEAAALGQYAEALRAARLRPRDMPSGRVVVQRATSTFVPRDERP